MSSTSLWIFFPLGYLLTILIETPILLCGLSPRHGLTDRFVAGFWLTACTYPIVILVLPPLMYENFPRWQYLVVAEIFAPVAECILFCFAYEQHPRADHRTVTRDFATITVANLTSFGIGEWLHTAGWF
jgi:hypothetical protein